MNIINSFQDKESIPINNQTKTENLKSMTKPTEEKKDILDIFSEKVINPKDINDKVEVPRSIFKGYLCFTTGASMTLIGSLIKNKTVNKTATIIGSLFSIAGTYNFVKPFLIKEKTLTKTEK